MKLNKSGLYRVGAARIVARFKGEFAPDGRAVFGHHKMVILAEMSEIFVIPKEEFKAAWATYAPTPASV